jgi:hypothetical protein
MTSRVKADVQVIDDELKVSGLEAVTSLIQTAKNLLNAVIQAVKLTYIASTKVRVEGKSFNSLILVSSKGKPKTAGPMESRASSTANTNYSRVDCPAEWPWNRETRVGAKSCTSNACYEQCPNALIAYIIALSLLQVALRSFLTWHFPPYLIKSHYLIPHTL